MKVKSWISGKIARDFPRNDVYSNNPRAKSQEKGILHFSVDNSKECHPALMRVCADENPEDNPAGICSPAGFNGLAQTVCGDLHGSAEMKFWH
ncbi:MAG: hypothetical protein GY750_00530 [Lentisphaerae bacterium]|nr:hypothetical protein [Lentisphaerota bacterium]